MIEPVRHGPREHRRVALTFDDGPALTTSAILDILDDRGTVATFFVVADLIPGREELVRRIVGSGSEIASHGLKHVRLGAHPLRAIRSARKAAAIIEAAAGTRPLWFRPPWGQWDAGLAAASRLARTPPVLWDVNSRDWQDPQPDAIRDEVRLRVQPGSIVLLHDGIHARPQTGAALPGILDDLEAANLEPVTVSTLLA